MARLDLVDLGHSYVADPAKDADWALKPFSATFEAGGTYALVGPSGCGKTTLLNILSGLVRASQGRVLFDGQDVTAQSTRHRNIAQVFQFPVIYQSMTVWENLAFPLQCRRWDTRRINERVTLVADALGLGHRLRQPARRLTADDKQLISLGRGLVRDDVSALLMDEPLTVIDPQLKSSLRRKIRELSEQFQPTVIYVTHDQYEAMSFAQELLVMRDGRVIQQGTPQELFERPSSAYVGYFIGSPAMNYLTVQRRGDAIRLGDRPLAMAWLPDSERSGELQAGIRPEYVRIAAGRGPNVFTARVLSVRDHGATRVIHAELAGQPLSLKLPREQGLPVGPEVLLELPAEKVLPYVDGELATLAPDAAA